jgi:hypothetical protein
VQSAGWVLLDRLLLNSLEHENALCVSRAIGPDDRMQAVGAYNALMAFRNNVVDLAETFREEIGNE